MYRLEHIQLVKVYLSYRYAYMYVYIVYTHTYTYNVSFTSTALVHSYMSFMALDEAICNFDSVVIIRAVLRFWF